MRRCSLQTALAFPRPEFLRRFLAFGIILLVSLPLSAQVNEDELERSQAPITFFNYEGPHARIETLEQIRGIGYGLGQIIRGGAARVGARNRYFVIHVTGPEEGSKLDADIFGLGYDVGVDHIRNLRLIVQGYLEAAYSYSAQDAALLARYITIYNAVYRGDWDYINGRYKGPVILELDPNQTGLSIRFDEWPGQTLMLIPLGLGQPNSLSAVDTSAVSDRLVVEEMRKDEDMGIEPRQEMVDLKEREAEEAEQRAQEQRREAAEEQRQIDEERRQIEEERRQIERTRPEPQEPPPPAQPAQPTRPQQPEQPGPRDQPPPAADSRQEEQDQRERELAEREEALDRRQEAVDEQREDARRDEELAEQKREEARQERESIAQDQQALINEEPRKESGPGIIAAIIETPDSPLGRIIRVSPDTGEEQGRSTMNMINIRTILNINGRIFAVAGENRTGAAVRLIEIDPETLDMKTQGSDDIHPQSPLWVSGADLFAITVVGGTPYLARFNYQLTRLARSSVALHPYAAVLFQEDRLLTQRQDGSALILNPQTLSEP